VDVDGLYGAPLERFVAERDELVRTLRKQGGREEAAKVAKLRKPSVAAWAVNQLVRTQSQSVAELFDAGDALRDAHRTATAGRGDGSTLRAASQRERSAVDALLEAAGGLLTSDGHELSPAIVDRVAETLRAAALDPDSRELVRGGRLERELRHVGLGVGLGAGADLAPAAPPRRREAKSAPTPKQAERREERAEAERLERERAGALKAAHAIEAKARRRAERTARALRVAQERRDRAAEDLEDADKALAAARAEAEAAGAEHDRIREQLERL
jgi:hypothetical protein